MKLYFSTITLAIFAVWASGCDKLLADKPAPAPAPVFVPPPPVPAAPVAPQMPAAPQASAAPTVAPAVVPPFQWTETPAFNTIPDAPVSGFVNQKQFVANTIILEQSGTSWRMVISDKVVASPFDSIDNEQAVYIDLPTPPMKGMNSMRPMEHGGGLFRIKNNPADPEATFDWIADNAWAIEITDWQAKDHDPNGPALQVTGTASGRIAICYKNSEGIYNSWLAGKFENATVRYTSKPFQASDKHASSGEGNVNKVNNSAPSIKKPKATKPGPSSDSQRPKFRQPINKKPKTTKQPATQKQPETQTFTKSDLMRKIPKNVKNLVRTKK